MSRDDLNGALDERDDDDLHPEDQQPDDDAHDPADDDDGARTREPDDGDDEDEDAEKRRERRRKERAERKARQREERQRQEARIASLDKRNRELESRLAAIEQRSTGHETAQIDRAISDTQAAILNAKAAIAKAIAEGNGEAAAAATDYYADAREHLRQLEARKAQAAQPEQPVIDHDAVRLSQAWMRENPWYDPRLGDEDSRIARVIDVSVYREGFHPGTREFWDEVNRRLRIRLPHRFAKAEAPPPAADDDDDPPPRRRSPVGGSGRDRAPASGNGAAYPLSQARIEALKLAGKWDDPEARKRAINAYREYDRQHGASAAR